MVKNNKGGSGHKKMARKDVFPNRVASKTRVAEDEYEYYAYIASMSGGQHCIATCQDGKNRLCIIRGKFRGAKGKRDNFITRGTWVLVGIRDWASETSKDNVLDKCDLLEVYNESDKIKLKTIPGIQWSMFINNDLSLINTSGEKDMDLTQHDIEFTNNVVEDEYKDLMNQNSSNKTTNNTITLTLDTCEEDINIDDI